MKITLNELRQLVRQVIYEEENVNINHFTYDTFDQWINHVKDEDYFEYLKKRYAKVQNQEQKNKFNDFVKSEFKDFEFDIIPKINIPNISVEEYVNRIPDYILKTALKPYKTVINPNGFRDYEGNFLGNSIRSIIDAAEDYTKDSIIPKIDENKLEISRKFLNDFEKSLRENITTIEDVKKIVIDTIKKSM